METTIPLSKANIPTTQTSKIKASMSHYELADFLRVTSSGLDVACCYCHAGFSSSHRAGSSCLLCCPMVFLAFGAKVSRERSLSLAIPASSGLRMVSWPNLQAL